ncbi:hypothetical protein J2X72_002353 [Phyllobacterium sp. 1468]|nr:hypothetical protein [Phyllobacterium sp. 1468]
MVNKPSESPVRETTNQARQGPLGRPVLNVLIVALLLALVAWGAAELYGERVDNAAGVGNTGSTEQSAPPAAPSADQPVTNAPVDPNPKPQTGSGGDTQTNPAPAN